MSRSVPLSVAECTCAATKSIQDCSPGRRALKRIVVFELNVFSLGRPLPSVRFRAMSYELTLSKSARSWACTWVKFGAGTNTSTFLFSRTITELQLARYGVMNTVGYSLIINLSTTLVEHRRHRFTVGRCFPHHPIMA